MTTDMLTLAEAARRLGVTPATVQRLCARRALVLRHTPAGWRVTRASVDDYQARRTTPMHQAIARGAGLVRVRVAGGAA